MYSIIIVISPSSWRKTSFLISCGSPTSSESRDSIDDPTVLLQCSSFSRYTYQSSSLPSLRLSLLSPNLASQTQPTPARIAVVVLSVIPHQGESGCSCSCHHQCPNHVTNPCVIIKQFNCTCFQASYNQCNTTISGKWHIIAYFTFWCRIRAHNCSISFVSLRINTIIYIVHGYILEYAVHTNSTNYLQYHKARTRVIYSQRFRLLLNQLMNWCA